MELFYVLLGLALGVGLAYWLLRAQHQALQTALRAEVTAAVRAQGEVERARLAQQYEARLHELELHHQAEIAQARRQSTDQSRAVLKGKLAEQMAPLLPGFVYLPADARFLGDPVDYVVFNGYSQVKDNGASGDDLEIVILDIKQGKSSLSPGQRQIARAVAAGRVRFEVVRVFANGNVKTYPISSKEPVAFPEDSVFLDC